MRCFCFCSERVRVVLSPFYSFFKAVDLIPGGKPTERLACTKRRKLREFIFQTSKLFISSNGLFRFFKSSEWWGLAPRSEHRPLFNHLSITESACWRIPTVNGKLDNGGGKMKTTSTNKMKSCANHHHFSWDKSVFI